MSNKDDDDFGFDESEFDEFEDDFEDDFADTDAQPQGEGDGGLDEDGREEWDYYEDDKDLENSGLGAQKEKKSIDLSFNTWAILGAVLVGIIVLVSTVMSEKAKITIDHFASVLKMAGKTDGPVFGDHEVQTLVIDESSKTSMPEEQKGFLYEPEVLDTMVKEMEGGPPMPTPISQEESALTPMAEEEVVRRANKTVQPDENISNVLPSANDILKSPSEPPKPDSPLNIEDIAEAKVEEMKQEVTKAALGEDVMQAQDEMPILTPIQDADITMNDMSQAVETISDETATVLEQRLNLIASRIDDLEQQIADLKASNSGNNSADMNEKIENLSQQVDKIKTTASTDQVAPKKQEQESSDVKKTSPSNPAPTEKKKAAPAPTWELRAAQPGKAWVAMKGQNNLKPIVVGDKLPGIGTVNTIVFRDGKWTVFGTAGSIRQK